MSFVVEKCVVLSTAAVDDVDVKALVAVSTMVVVRFSKAWRVVVRASVLEIGVFDDGVDVLVSPTEVFAYAVIVEEVVLGAFVVVADEVASVVLAKVVVTEGDAFDVAVLADATTAVFEGFKVSLLAVVVSTLVEGKALLV